MKQFDDLQMINKKECRTDQGPAVLGNGVKVVLVMLAASSSFQLAGAASEAESSVTSPDSSVCSCSGSDAVDKPFAGLTINVLGRSFGHGYFMEKVSEWEKLTGAKVNVPVVAGSGGELNELTWEDMSTGANYYDGYIATNQNIPTLAHEIDPDTKQPWILNMDTLVKNSVTLDWPGIHSIFREYLCLYDDHIYTLPFDGDQFFLYYRRDLQERDGWEVPQTWDDLIKTAELYEDQDLNGDGESDYAMCQPNMGDMAFYSLYAPLISLLQTHPDSDVDVKKRIFPKRHGVFFDLGEEGMAPLVDNAAFRRVLPLMQRIYELGRREDLNLCCKTKSEGDEKNSGHGLFRTGRCAFYYSFPSVGTNSIIETLKNNETTYPYQHGRMGTAELPGWTEYLDRTSDTLKPCSAEECPASIPLSSTTNRRLNRASWFANGGMGSVINSRVGEIKQLAAFNLFAYFSKTLETTRAGVPYNPFRDPKHFQLGDYMAAGWNEIDAKLYLDAARKSLENKNAAIDLRVPYALTGTENGRGFFRAYVHHFNEYYRMMSEEKNIFSNESAVITSRHDSLSSNAMEKVVADLDREIKEWLTTHDTKVASSDTYWTGTIELIYRRSMSLPLRAEPVTRTHHSIQNIRWFGWTLAAVIILSSLFFIAWVFLKRKRRIVKASQPLFLIMICLGTLVMGASLFPLGIDDSITTIKGCDIACMAWPWLFTCGFTISFSVLFSKQWRITKIFNNPSFSRIKVTEKDVIIPVVTMFTLNVIFLLSWTLVDPLKWERVQVDPLNSYGRCAAEGNGKASNVFFSLIAVINASALILANIQAYRARTISDEFSESKYIAIAMASMLQMVLFSLPVAFLVKDSPSARYFVYSGIIFVIAMPLLMLMFVPKVRLVHKFKTDAKHRQSSGNLGIRVKKLGDFSSSFHSEHGINNSLRDYPSSGNLGFRGSSHNSYHQPRSSLVESNEYKEKLRTLKSKLEEQGVNAESLFEEAGLTPRKSVRFSIIKDQLDFGDQLDVVGDQLDDPNIREQRQVQQLSAPDANQQQAATEENV